MARSNDTETLQSQQGNCCQNAAINHTSNGMLLVCLLQCTASRGGNRQGLAAAGRQRHRLPINKGSVVQRVIIRDWA